MGKILDPREAERALLVTSVPSFGVQTEDNDGNITKHNELRMEYVLLDINGVEIARRYITHVFPHIENELPNDTSQRITDNVLLWYAQDHLELTNNQLGG